MQICRPVGEESEDTAGHIHKVLMLAEGASATLLRTRYQAGAIFSVEN